MVDVVLVGGPAEGRARYQAARALSALGPPAPAFAAAQQAMAIPGSVLVSGVPRGFAHRALEALEEHGGRARTTRAVEDVAVPDQPPGSRLSSVLVVSILLALAGFGLYTWTRHLGGDEDEIDMPTRGARAVAGPSLDTRQLAARLAPATVTLRCAGSLGSGFFVAKDLVLTSAHVLCPPGEPLRVALSNGNESAATPEQRDDWLDLALVRVPGADAEPLPLGDSTGLRPGDRVVFAGISEGPEPAVHEATVSHGARSVFGLAFLQINGAVSPGAGGGSGGPLMDSHGRVVGVVSARGAKSDGLSLALPINYAYTGDKQLLPPPVLPAPDEQSWRRLLGKVALADRKEVQRAVSPSGQPALLGLTTAADKGLTAVIARRTRTAPRPETLTFVFHSGDRVLCKVTAVAGTWRNADSAGQQTDGSGSRYMQWMRKNNLEKDVFLGYAPLDVQGCPLEEMRGGQVVLEGADERADSANV